MRNWDQTLSTFGRRKPFVLERIDYDGIVLLLGEGRNHTPLPWDCLVAVVLQAAGVVRVDMGPPLRVRLTEQFMRHCLGAA